MSGRIKVPSELVPSQSNKVLMRSKYLYDDTKGKTQEEVNVDLNQKIDTKDAELNQKIDSKVIAAEAVPYDNKPTAGSTNIMQSQYIKKAIENYTGYFVLDNNIEESTVNKTVTGDDKFVLPANGTSVKILMHCKNTASNPTLNINDTGAKPLWYNGAVASATNTWSANEVISVYTDGTKYFATNVQGRDANQINKYLYDNIRKLNIGELYDVNETVKSNDNILLQVTKEIRRLSLTDEVVEGDLRIYNDNTYKALKSVLAYNSDRPGGYVDNDCAIGAPARITLAISREIIDGSITVNFNGTNHTIAVQESDELSDITNYVLTALDEVEGWTFESNTTGIIIATSTAHGSFSNTVWSLTPGANTGIIGVRSLVSNGVADSEEGADDGTSTILQLTVSKGVGTINVILGEVEHEIQVASTDDADTIAETIAETSYENWSLSFTDNVITIVSLQAKIYKAADIKIVDGVLGVTGTTTISFSGNEGNVCKYDGTNDIWAVIQKGDYVSAAWTAITIEELQTYTTPNNIHNLLLDEKRKLAYILGNHERRITYYDANKMGSVEAYILAKALIDLKYNSGGGSSESSLSGTITPGNSDSILIIGSSFGAVLSAYVLPGKHWTQVLDLFTDYVLQNVSADGSSNVDHLMWLRNGRTLPYQNTRFALLVNSENLGGGVNTLYKSFVNLANCIKSFGIQPIIGTSHRNGSGFRQYHQYISSLLRKWCVENNTIFMDAGQYAASTIKDGSGYSSHLNERQSPTVAYAYMDALAGLERPRQSLKTYKLRPNTSHTSLDELVFMDVYERARRFIPTAISTTFTDYALISVVLPATSNFLETVILSLSSPNDITVYCLDSNATPYPTPGSSYTRFHISEQCSIQAGDKYTYNGTTFTVVHVVTDNPYGEFCDAYCTPALSAADSTSGTLTKQSGNGSASIPFNGYGIASMSEASTVLNDLGGHWVRINSDGNNNYELSEKLTKVFYDQVYFLVECSGNFTINEVYVKWKATREKTLIRNSVPDFTINAFNSKTEIISEPTFGASGTTLSQWKDENNAAIVSSSTSPVPPECSSVVTISNTHKMSISIPTTNLRNGRAVLEILARNNQSSVTGTSWDWSKLYVSLIRDTTTTYEAPVGLAWKIVRIPIEIIGLVGGFFSTTLTIHAEKENMQIAKVSLKYI